MILELDAGNTRIKWRLLDRAAGGDSRIAFGQAASVTDMVVNLAEELESLSPRQVDRVRVCSVRNAGFAQDLQKRLKALTGREPEFAGVTASCAGVANSYTDINTMGVDRWLAMLAAYNEAQGAVCVADFGSAMTLDLVATSGQHLGGYIVPGLRLMQESLAVKSEALPYQALRHISTKPGKSTAEAIQQGILAMQLGFLESVRRAASPSAQWVLCGGDARLISDLLAWPHEVRPDLVMDGLKLALP